MDIHAHGGDPDRALGEIRDWLSNVSRRELPSAARVGRLHHAFFGDLPAVSIALGFDPDNIPYVDYERIVARRILEAPAFAAE